MYIGATWRTWLNFSFIWPIPVHNPNDNSIGSAASAQLTAESPYLTMGDPFPKIVPSHEWSGPHLIHASLGQSVRVHNPNGITIGSAVFEQVTAQCPYTLQWAAAPPSNFATLNRGRHLYSAGRPSRWALAHILVLVYFISRQKYACNVRNLLVMLSAYHFEMFFLYLLIVFVESVWNSISDNQLRCYTYSMRYFSDKTTLRVN